MPRIFGYVCSSKDDPQLSDEVQRDAIHDHVLRYGLGDRMTITDYIDPRAWSRVPLRGRPAGGYLLATLRPDDKLVVSRLVRTVSSVADLRFLADTLVERRVDLHVCGQREPWLDAHGPQGRVCAQLLGLVDDFRRSLKSECVKIGIARRAIAGRRHSRLPGYGFKWVSTGKVEVWPDGTLKKMILREEDAAERAVMRQIVAWREQTPPPGWHRIYHRLNHELQVRTPSGKPWDVCRIRRCY